jgi:hypothetical protein
MGYFIIRLKGLDFANWGALIGIKNGGWDKLLLIF